MTEPYLTKDDWTALKTAADRSARGLRPYLSAEQATRLQQRGYIAAVARDSNQYTVTAAGKAAVQNWLKSLR
jgi:hypothetical protein